MCSTGLEQELERDLEASRVAVRALASQRASLANEAAAAEAQAAVAQRRIPELENDKKAAAAARVRQPLLVLAPVAISLPYLLCATAAHLATPGPRKHRYWLTSLRVTFPGCCL